jgi:hypothetical protein
VASPSFAIGKIFSVDCLLRSAQIDSGKFSACRNGSAHVWNSCPFFKDDRFDVRLGELLAPMPDRGPDSARFAIYGTGIQGRVKVTVFAATGVAALDGLLARMTRELEVEETTR